MENSLFSSSQAPEDLEKLNKDIREAVFELQMEFPEQEITALYWNDIYIAIPVKLKINLPTRGSVDGIDIRNQEPVILLFNRNYYPYKAPLVWSNRKDFPSSQLPHLNPTTPGKPARFCLHRGNIDDWFAEHTIADLVRRTQAWLRDAARNRLVRPEDGFEVTRFDSGVFGYSIYEPHQLKKQVYSAWRQASDNAGFATLWYTLLKNPQKEPLIEKDTFALRLVRSVGSKDITDLTELFHKYNGLYSEENILDRHLFGILAWPSKSTNIKKYFAEFPHKLDDFIEWVNCMGIPLEKALDNYLSNSLQLFGGIPITLVVPRPQRLIGTRSRLELINFLLIAGGEHWPKDGKWDLDTTVRSMGHRNPLTIARARSISSQAESFDLGGLLFLGCGAIGSKLVLHLAKSGQTDMTLVDYDDFSPHNLVRHGLLHESLGMNKAEALKKVIDGIFYVERSSNVKSIKESSLSIFFGSNQGILNNNSWLIDATASSMVLNVLVQANLPDTLSCCRSEIADEGRLGFLSLEGPKRNPRLDDLQVLLFDSAITNKKISQWLLKNKDQRESEVGSTLEEVNVGISCSSDTMRLADEVVSIHSAGFATGFRKYAIEKNSLNCGRLQISTHNTTKNTTTIIQHFDIDPITILKSRNNPLWQVRLRSGIKEAIQSLLAEERPNETGGLLIGMVSFKRKTIYVSRILLAPPDSKSSPYAFIRGIQDVPDEVLNIQRLTGGMLGYVGEWHTHPAGGPDLSQVDMAAVKTIKKHLDKVPIPTHIIIATNRGLYPHIFMPT